MSFRIKAADYARIEKSRLELEARQREVEDVFLVFNKEVQELYGPVKDALEAYDSVAVDVQEFLTALIEDFQNEFADKSENWQDGDKGQMVSDWIDTLDTISTTELPQIDPPVDLELPSFDLGDELNSISDRPNA